MEKDKRIARQEERRQGWIKGGLLKEERMQESRVEEREESSSISVKTKNFTIA